MNQSTRPYQRCTVLFFYGTTTASGEASDLFLGEIGRHGYLLGRQTEGLQPSCDFNGFLTLSIQPPFFHAFFQTFSHTLFHAFRPPQRFLLLVVGLRRDFHAHAIPKLVVVIHLAIAVAGLFKDAESGADVGVGEQLLVHAVRPLVYLSEEAKPQKLHLPVRVGRSPEFPEHHLNELHALYHAPAVLVLDDAVVVVVLLALLVVVVYQGKT